MRDSASGLPLTWSYGESPPPAPVVSFFLPSDATLYQNPLLVGLVWCIRWVLSWACKDSPCTSKVSCYALIIVIRHVQFYIYRLHKVKQTRKAMSDDMEVHHLPAGYHGAYIQTFQEVPCQCSGWWGTQLLWRIVQHIDCWLCFKLVQFEKSIPDDLKIVCVVKLSGDGTKFSSTFQFILLSFSLPFLSNALSGYGKLIPCFTLCILVQVTTHLLR